MKKFVYDVNENLLGFYEKDLYKIVGNKVKPGSILGMKIDRLQAIPENLESKVYSNKALFSYVKRGVLAFAPIESESLLISKILTPGELRNNLIAILATEEVKKIKFNFFPIPKVKEIINLYFPPFSHLLYYKIKEKSDYASIEVVEIMDI